MIAGIALGVVIAAAFGLGGYYLVGVMDNNMGLTLFVLLPVATGFATALMTRGKATILASLVIAAILCTAMLLLGGQEGWVCVLMSAPLIIGGLALGALMGWALTLLIKYFFQREKTATFLTLGALPFFLMGASNVEQQLQPTPRAETITNTLVTEASREVVWEQLKTFDRIEGTKGLLMTIGLPVPVSCDMSGEGVGATRTCYFEEGRIEERVTEWNPPSTMKFEIVAFDVPGRPWLSFKDASYELTTEGGKTVLTRKTTIVSILGPAWYWRPLEKIGVETEHEYLFEEVKRKIEVAK